MSAKAERERIIALLELAGGVQRETVSFGVERIDALWQQAEDTGKLSPCLFVYAELDGAEYFDTIGRYNLWTMTDGSTWAIVGTRGVMVVKPETSET